MSKKGRVARPKGELERELRDQLALLEHACSSFDGGLEAVGRHLAMSLRVLLHEHGNSRALLEQLGLRTGRFVDSAGGIDPRNLLPQCNLVILEGTASEGRYVPLVAGGDFTVFSRLVPFEVWWNEHVLRDGQGRLFNRRTLVGHVADTDGGAHVDPELEEGYMALSRSNSLGWTFQSADVLEPFRRRPELACMRQIAEEVLLTLRRRHPKAFGA